MTRSMGSSRNFIKIEGVPPKKKPFVDVLLFQPPLQAQPENETPLATWASRKKKPPPKLGDLPDPENWLP